MSRKTIEVDSEMIDKTLEDLAKLILRLDENTKKTRKERNRTQLRKFKKYAIHYRIRCSMRN